MKPISDWVNGNSASLSEPSCSSGSSLPEETPNGKKPSTENVLTDEMMTRLWTKMQQMYGHRWASSYGDATENGGLSETAKTWQRGLRGMSPQRIAKGLDRCLTRFEEWPPTLPQFRKMCLVETEPNPHAINAAAYKPPKHLALPRPRPSCDHARPFLQALRAALKRQEMES